MTKTYNEIYASRQSGKILTEMLSAVEKYKLNDKEEECAILFVDNFKVIIPFPEMGVREDWHLIRSMIGAEIDFIVKGIDTEGNIVVASRKEAMLLRRKLELPKYQAGDTINVRVVGVGRDQAYVDAYGVEVAIPKNEIDYGYVGNVEDYVQIGDRIESKILEIDHDTYEIKLSIKDAKPDPYATIDNKYRIQGEYLGTVTGIPHYGVFVNLEQGVSALCPLPRWADFNPNIGDKVLIKMKKINKDGRKISANLVRVIKRANYLR